MLSSLDEYILMKSYQILSDHIMINLEVIALLCHFRSSMSIFNVQNSLDNSWYIMINRDKSWYIMILSDIVWYYLIFCDISWYIMIYHDNSMLKSMSHYFCPIKHVVAVSTNCVLSSYSKQVNILIKYVVLDTGRACAGKSLTPLSSPMKEY